LQLLLYATLLEHAWHLEGILLWHLVNGSASRRLRCRRQRR